MLFDGVTFGRFCFLYPSGFSAEDAFVIIPRMIA
jgi:hypothetical protein